MHFDVRTMLYMVLLVSIAFIAALFIGWRTYLRQRQMQWWLASTAVLAAGGVMLALRGYIHDDLSVLVGNQLVIISTWMLLVGSEYAIDRRPAWRVHTTALVASGLAYLYFYSVVDSFFARAITFSSSVCAFSIVAALVLRRGPPQTSRSRDIAVVLLVLIGLTQLGRLSASLRTGSPDELLSSGPGILLVLSFAVVVRLLLAFVWVVMAGERLQEENLAARRALDEMMHSGMQALQQSDERFTLAVQGSSIGVWDWDVRANHFFVSALGKALLGYEEHEGQNSYVEWGERLHPDDRERARARIGSYLRSGAALFSLEHRLRHKDGSYRWLLARGASRRDDRARVYRISGSIEDITERKQAEHAHHFLARHAHVGAGEDFFASLSRYLADTLVADAVLIDRVSTDGLVAYGEAAYVDGTLHASEIHPVQETVLSTFLSEDVRCFANAARAAYPMDSRLEALKAEGYVGITLRNADGQAIGVISVVSRRAIPDPQLSVSLLTLFALPAAGELIRKQADEALRAREEYSRTLLSSLPAGVVVHGPDTSILDCNTMACSLLGLTPDQMRGKTAIDPAWAFLGEDRMPMPLAHFPVNRVVSTGRPLNGLVVGIGVPGRPDLTWAVCNAYPVRNVDGRILQIVVTFVEVTERIRSEEARGQLESQLRQSQKMEAVGQLAGGIAHDFNNLLTVITGIADVAIRGVAADNPLRRDLVDIQLAGQRAAVLTRQLLAFGRKQTIVPEVLSMRGLIDGMQPLLTRVIREDVTLVLDPGTVDGEVLADPGHIEQVLLNLALNARDAMPHGGTLTFKLDEVEIDAAFVRAHPGMHMGPHVRVDVRDTGTGMDDTTRARIFEPFYTTKQPGQGTGLGLATVYGIVSQNGGAIEVKSAVGAGTTFSVYLPLARGLETDARGTPRFVRAISEADPLPAGNTPDPVNGTGTILVVEDEIAIRRLAKRVLESAGYLVLTANDGVDALRVLAEHGSAVDLLLTDVIMPNMNGPELAARVAELYPSTRVLYASGYAGDADLGVDAIGASSNFLPKPYQVIELTRKVREIMTKGRA